MSQQMAALQTKQAKLKDYLNRIAYSRKFADLGARNRRAYEELAWAYVIEKEVVWDLPIIFTDVVGSRRCETEL